MTILVLAKKGDETEVGRKSIIENARLFGHSLVDGVLDPVCQVYQTPRVEGFIGYRLEFSRAIVFGDPLCAREDIPTLVADFQNFCEKQGIKNIIYVSASETFSKWATQKGCAALIEFAEELTLDPHHDPKAKTGANAHSVRRKVRHAIKEDVCVKEYTSQDPDLEKKLESVGESWLASRKGLQIHISNIYLFDNRFGKRWFYAQQGDRVVGVAVLNWIDLKKGWLLNNLLFTSDAPQGTPELLVTTVLDQLAKEECHYVTFGPVPSEQLGEVIGFGSFSAQFARVGYRLSSRLFHLAGKKKFWQKFNP